MKLSRIHVAALCALAVSICTRAGAEQVVERPGEQANLGETTPTQLSTADESQVRFLGYFLTRGEVSNVAPSNELLQGQTIGRLFGPNSTTTNPQKSVFAEQRFIPFIIVEPRVLSGLARLRASFDLKWTWGDSSYGTGGNFGGAVSGHQVNLQTNEVEVELNLPRPGWTVNIGLQRLYDNVRDPYRTFLNTLSLTGDRLAFWGTAATGLTVYGREMDQLYKFGAYQLYENKISTDDDVYLFEAMTDRHLGHTLHVGGHIRYLRDRASGAGGASILGEGPNSLLADYNGGYRFPVGSFWHADLFWVGLDTSINPEFTSGRFGGSAFAVANFGSIDTKQADNSYQQAASVFGVALDARAGYRWGATRDDVLVAEGMYTTGDGNGLSDKHYSGVITGNQYAAPGAAFSSFGTYLLMPHPIAVNRFYGAVQDLSNIGYGVTAGSLNAYWGVIPNKLVAKIGGAVGGSSVGPPKGGHLIGAEVNAMLTYHIGTFLDVEAHGAYLKLGSFYDSPAVVATGRPRDPYTIFTDLKWLLF